LRFKSIAGWSPQDEASALRAVFVNPGTFMTREIQASEAKAYFGTLLDQVERGETVIITRGEHTVARIVPEVGRAQQNVGEIADIKELRKRTGKVSVEELLAWQHEGHKY
jgi:prevent-host-death family protein